MKKAIILERDEGKVRICLWASVPQTLWPFYAAAGAKSVWTGATSAENGMIAQGKVAEKVIEVAQETTLDEATKRVRVQNEANKWQAYVNTYNPWDRYGTYWDDVAGWTTAGAVAHATTLPSLPEAGNLPTLPEEP